MALANRSVDGSRFDWGRAGRELWKQARSPWCIAYFAFALTAPFWIPATVYGLLKSCLVAPSGLWIWLSLLVVGCLVLWGIGGLFATVVKCARRKRQVDRTGSPEQRRAAAAEYREHVGRRIWRLWCAAIATTLFIPLSVSLVLLTSFQEPTYIHVVHGKRAYATPRQNLEYFLRSRERRGIFTPL
ncbi:MAG TPA: hypothetical protein VHE55_00905 [Fimbriimonadaceae bacterium]|nr:hypothetical protein [Fimbriimonadaceae bacterium]